MRSLTSAPLKCALLGVGHPHSAALLATLKGMPEIGEVILWDADPAALRAAQAPGQVNAAPADLEKILARADLHFAIVCAPADEGLALGLRVVAAGKHLLIEKPPGLTVAEVARLTRAVDAAGVLASVLYMNRLHPAAIAARELCQSGKLGPLISLEGRFITTQVRLRQPESWIFQRARAGGGILSWLGCHFLDLLQFISGQPVTAVAAALAQRNGVRIDVEDTAALSLWFADGSVGTLHTAYALAFSGGGYMNPLGNDGYLAFNGQNGRVVWGQFHKPQLHIETDGGARRRNFRLAATGPGAASVHCRVAFLRQFVQALRGEADVPAPLSAALQTAHVIAAAYRSARSGRRVEIPAPTRRKIRSS